MTRARPLSFRARLTVRWTAVFSSVLAVASVWIFIGIRTQSYSDLDRYLRTLAGTELTAALDGADPHVHELPVTALAGGTFTEKLVQVFNARGEVVASSPGLSQSVRLVAPDVIAATLLGEAPVDTVLVEGVPVRVVVLRTSVTGRAYAIAVGLVITDLVSSLTRLGWLLALVWLVSTAATAAVGFALASTALRPVKRITQRAMDIATTDLSARLEPPKVDDEIGLMTRSLNTLIERLHGALDANRRFAADAAHELRSPVTAISGEIDVALRRERSAADYKDTLILVKTRMASLSSLIGDLMLLVRAQEANAAVRTQEVPLDALLGGSVERLAELAESRGVGVRLGDVNGLLVYGDPGLLGRVFDNVIENAIRYNREHGEVALSAAFEDAARGAWTPGLVTIRISDTGSGIPEKERERVFERFYRLDQSRSRHTGGAGLGLAIAREVLAVFKGSIRIAHSSAAGTTMEIQLPGRASHPAGAAAPDQEPSLSIAPVPTRNVSFSAGSRHS